MAPCHQRANMATFVAGCPSLPQPLPHRSAATAGTCSEAAAGPPPPLPAGREVLPPAAAACFYTVAAAIGTALW